jgi:hypothetical protein
MQSLKLNPDVTKPDFMVIGAQKCATSWLDYHLEQHPQIMLPTVKDVEFFSYSVNLNPEITKAWLERFDDAVAGQRVGDVNAAYFWTETGSPWGVKQDSFNRRIPESVHAFLGDDVQFIISLRNPVERTVSAYLHHISHGAVSPEQKILEISEPLGIVDMGFFGAHLQNWLQVYPASHFLVLRDLPSDRNSADSLMAGTLDFLGVEAFPQEHDFEKRVFPGMQRLNRADGVWVPAAHPAIAAHLPLQRTVPMLVEDGVQYLRLVDTSELERLQQIFEPDQALLNELLAADGMTVLDPTQPAKEVAGS